MGRESVIRMQHCVTDMDARFLKDSGSSFPQRFEVCGVQDGRPALSWPSCLALSSLG